MEEKLTKNPFTRWKLLLVLLVVLVAAVVVLVVVLAGGGDKATQEREKVITVSRLERIIDISKLSTYTAVYNGVARVYSKENPEEVEYYVSYQSRVDVGIEANDIKIDLDEEGKIIHVHLPEIQITDITVDPGSLDYIFVNQSANDASATAEAYRICEKDVEEKSKGQGSIFELAKQNAINTVTALTKPLVEQIDGEYELEVD